MRQVVSRSQTLAGRRFAKTCSISNTHPDWGGH